MLHMGGCLKAFKMSIYSYFPIFGCIHKSSLPTDPFSYQISVCTGSCIRHGELFILEQKSKIYLNKSRVSIEQSAFDSTYNLNFASRMIL